MLRSKYKNLIIIGNGFDRWQGLPTSYEKFYDYYIANVERVMEELHLPKYTVTDCNGRTTQVTSVELIYGASLNRFDMPKEFFCTFENYLDKLDDQQLNANFGRSKEGVAQLKQLVKEAQKILRTLFCNWVLSIDIEKKDTGFCFPEDCFFINFNYTDTLEKRFGVNSNNIYHIHGSAEDADSIIVGHSSHPETAFSELMERNIIKPLKPGARLPRIDGLYAVEDALYQTDKHVEDNIDALCGELFRRGVHIEDFENIYVLGHSFGDADIGYFEYIDRVTRCGCDYDSLSAAERLDTDLFALLVHGDDDISEKLLLKMIKLNIEYAAHHRDRIFEGAESLYPELDKLDEENGIVYYEQGAAYAVKQRFLMEQSKRTQDYLLRLAKEKGMKEVPEGCHSVLGFADFYDYGHEPRKRNAFWHISYFSDDDAYRIKKIMKKFGLKRYKLYKGIDKCIETF